MALRVAGPRTALEESRLALARELGDRYAALRPAIERALFEHCRTGPPWLRRSEQVWEHVAPVRVRIEPLGGVGTVEIAPRPETRSIP